MKKSAKYLLNGFIKNIAESTKACFYPTGFNALDNILDGGLYAGLYCIGAISSLGKTTFCIQIADHLARSGKDVLIFSLEMAKEELIAKSISRHTLLENWKQSKSAEKAKTTRGILTGSRYKNYTQAERVIIQDALSAYEDYAEHIYISEGIGNIGVDQIRAAVEEHIKATGEEPAILIDYMQILAPTDPRSTDKQNTDKAVLELKRMSRDYNIPVIGISSFNRDNYSAPVNLASFKESGAIEYSSDVLLGLQYLGMDYYDGEKEQDRARRVRELLRLQAEAGKKAGRKRYSLKCLRTATAARANACLTFTQCSTTLRTAPTRP
jgi:replicative DNA helicase